MLWVHPEIYTLKDLLEAYPRAQIFNTHENRVISYEEVEQLAQEEYGRKPIVDDLRWDSVYLRDSEGDVIPLSAGEQKLDEENAKIRQHALDLEFQVQQLQKGLEIDKSYWYLDIRFITGIVSGLVVSSIWSRLFGH